MRITEKARKYLMDYSTLKRCGLITVYRSERHLKLDKAACAKLLAAHCRVFQQLHQLTPSQIPSPKLPFPVSTYRKPTDLTMGLQNSQ